MCLEFDEEGMLDEMVNVIGGQADALMVKRNQRGR